MIILRREKLHDAEYITEAMEVRFPKVLMDPKIKNVAFRTVSKNREIIFKESNRGAPHYAIFLIDNDRSCMRFVGYMPDTTLAGLPKYNESNTKNFRYGKLRCNEMFYVVSLVSDLVPNMFLYDDDDDVDMDTANDDDDDMEGVFKWDLKTTKNIDLLETMLREKTPLAYCKNPNSIAGDDDAMHNIVLHFLIVGFNRSGDLLERIIELETQIHPSATLRPHLKNLREGFKNSLSVPSMKNPYIRSLLDECQAFLFLQ